MKFENLAGFEVSANKENQIISDLELSSIMKSSKKLNESEFSFDGISVIEEESN